MSSIEFLCPECEHRHFVEAHDSVGHTVGRCRGCGHTWYRLYDYLYFIEVHRFSTPKEYERARKRGVSFALTTGVLLVLAVAFVAIRMIYSVK